MIDSYRFLERRLLIVGCLGVKGCLRFGGKSIRSMVGFLGNLELEELR